MTNAALLQEIRVRLGDTDGILDVANVDYTDEYIYKHIESAIFHLEATEVTDTTYTVTDTTLSPEPSTIDGLLFATFVVMQMLGGDFSARVRNGEFGIRFKSGQDEISTIEASKKIDSVLKDARKEYRAYVIAKIGSRTAGASRLQ